MAAPTLGTPTLTVTSPSSLRVQVSTDQVDGNAYVVVTDRSVAPSAADVKLGVDALASVVFAASTPVILATVTLNLTELAGVPSGTLYAHAMQENSGAEQSVVATSAGLALTGGGGAARNRSRSRARFRPLDGYV